MARNLDNRPDIQEWVNSNKRLKFRPSDKPNILIEYNGSKDKEILKEANSLPGLISSYGIKGNTIAIVFLNSQFSSEADSKSTSDSIDGKIENFLEDL